MFGWRDEALHPAEARTASLRFGSTAVVAGYPESNTSGERCEEAPQLRWPDCADEAPFDFRAEARKVAATGLARHV